MFWFKMVHRSCRLEILTRGHSSVLSSSSNTRGGEFCIQKSISGAAASARIWAGHYTCRLLTAAFLPPFATYRVKNYQRRSSGAGVSYGPVLSNIYVNTLPECHTTNNRGVNGISRKFSQYLEKAHTLTISLLKVPNITFAFKNLLRQLIML